MSFTFGLNESITVLTVFAGLVSGWAYLKYTTNNNAKESQKQGERITKLESKCNEMIEEDKAFKSFVTIDIFNQQTKHIDDKISDIKTQNNTIINLLTKER
ncbi:MAG: hypothetical protein AB7D96_10685 [Arcobacteraceae bacterium]